ncbi:hypothetical protein GGR58DRAFT_426677 [Xylaria digitata]|nr:hypothetical protein GGR58DRAFT_426677 [Xylaria digitata]
MGFLAGIPNALLSLSDLVLVAVTRIGRLALPFIPSTNLHLALDIYILTHSCSFSTPEVSDILQPISFKRKRFLAVSAVDNLPLLTYLYTGIKGNRVFTNQPTYIPAYLHTSSTHIYKRIDVYFVGILSLSAFVDHVRFVCCRRQTSPDQTTLTRGPYYKTTTRSLTHTHNKIYVGLSFLKGFLTESTHFAI